MKTYYKLLIFISCIIVAIGLFLYYFFFLSSNYALDFRKELDVDGTKVVFKAKAKELKMELNDPSAFEKDKEIAKEISTDVYITIESSKKVMCTYDLGYAHKEDYIRYSKTNSDKKEFTITYANGDEMQIEDYSKSGVLVGNYSINGPTYEESAKATLKFYNLEENQQTHVNAVYGIVLGIENVKCSLIK